MQASLPREKWRGLFLKSTSAGIVPGTTICSNSNIFKPLKNREAS